MENTIASSRSHVSDLTKTALVAALYVVVTVILAVISFGAVQLRLSEMFNYLALFNKRYVYAVTLGVVLANFYSPTWIIDVPLGGIATLLVLLLCRALTKNIQRIKIRHNGDPFHCFDGYSGRSANYCSRITFLAYIRLSCNR